MDGWSAHCCPRTVTRACSHPLLLVHRRARMSGAFCATSSCWTRPWTFSSLSLQLQWQMGSLSSRLKWMPGPRPTSRALWRHTCAACSFRLFLVFYTRPSTCLAASGFNGVATQCCGSHGQYKNRVSVPPREHFPDAMFSQQPCPVTDGRSAPTPFSCARTVGLPAGRLLVCTCIRRAPTPLLAPSRPSTLRRWPARWTATRSSRSSRRCRPP